MNVFTLSNRIMGECLAREDFISGVSPFQEVKEEVAALHEEYEPHLKVGKGCTSCQKKKVDKAKSDYLAKLGTIFGRTVATKGAELDEPALKAYLEDNFSEIMNGKTLEGGIDKIVLYVPALDDAGNVTKMVKKEL